MAPSVALRRAVRRARTCGPAARTSGRATGILEAGTRFSARPRSGSWPRWAVRE